MDIAALSTSLSQMSLSQAVGLRVMNLAKDQAETQTQGLIQALQQSVHPNLGSKLDIRV
ncbi:YjfB family protein [Paenibacillus sp. CN-4]|uniref:YjfB family protein n=1 Tax=Paenibacillus nanchangensis TaxID=3348343 RepID=UPI0039783F91